MILTSPQDAGRSPVTPAHVAEALMFNGITPPDYGTRTTCPVCSHTRQKSREKCLSIYTSENTLRWLCHHCAFCGEDRIQ